MKRVLIITYYWPPSGGAGVQRWLKFVKYLRLYGWEPVVYTSENGEMPVIDQGLLKEVPAGTEVLKTPIWEPYSIYKKFIGRKSEERINAAFLNEGKKTGLAEKISVWIRGNFFIPDARRFWIKPSIQFLKKYLLKSQVHAIVSTGPPHSMHLIALGLKKEFKNLAWVADFRDPWTNIDFYEKLMPGWLADKKQRWLELNVLMNANIVLSIGQSMNDEFREMYKQAGGKDLSKFQVITNGYDSDDIDEMNVVKDVKFSIAHVGTLVKDRNPDVLWKVLNKMIKEDAAFREKLEIKLVGKTDIFVKERIEKWGLTGFVNELGYLSHDKVIKEQQRSRILLLLVNNTKNAKGILTGKVFEYLASGTPILAIGPENGDLAKILNETGGGLMSGFENEDQLEKNILASFNGWLPKRNEDEIRKYDRKELTRQLCRLLTETS